MPITVTCQCGRRLQAQDADAGKRAKCPACGAYLHIPQRPHESVGSGSSVYEAVTPRHCLTVLKGPDLVHERFRLSRARVATIGRELDNTVVLRDMRISRHHCQMSWTDRGWLLEDLASTNGTYVNGEKVDEKVLEGGERVRLGSFELRFEAPVDERAVSARLEEQLESLKSGDPESSRAAMEFLASCGVKAADYLVPKLSGYDTITGHLAMEVLERLGPDAVPALSHTLKGKDKLKRSSAARALGRLGAEAASAVPDLLEALDDRDPLVHAEAAWALTEIGPAAVPGLLAALRSGAHYRRASAAWALGRIGPHAAEAIPALRVLAGSSDPELSQVASAALRQIGDDKTTSQT